jgi:hypothetical protein
MVSREVAPPTPVKASRKGKVPDEVLWPFLERHTRPTRSLSWPVLKRLLEHEEGVTLSHGQLRRRFLELPSNPPAS